MFRRQKVRVEDSKKNYLSILWDRFEYLWFLAPSNIIAKIKQTINITQLYTVITLVILLDPYNHVSMTNKYEAAKRYSVFGKFEG
jgi:alpha-D-ribose 1-methylphosphonate 5-triphosphate synthase subunit PhnL